MRNVFRWTSIVLFAAVSVFLILFGALYSSVPAILPFHAAAIPAGAQEAVKPIYFALMKLIGGASAGLGLLGLWVTFDPIRRGSAGAVAALVAGYSAAILMAAYVAETLAASAGAPTSWHLMGVLMAILAGGVLARMAAGRVARR